MKLKTTPDSCLLTKMQESENDPGVFAIIRWKIAGSLELGLALPYQLLSVTTLLLQTSPAWQISFQTLLVPLGTVALLGIQLLCTAVHKKCCDSRWWEIAGPCSGLPAIFYLVIESQIIFIVCIGSSLNIKVFYPI